VAVLRTSPPRIGDNLKTEDGPRDGHAIRAAILGAGAACFPPKWPGLNARWPVFIFVRNPTYRATLIPITDHGSAQASVAERPIALPHDNGEGAR
jgi:hypothetical protein